MKTREQLYLELIEAVIIERLHEIKRHMKRAGDESGEFMVERLIVEIHNKKTSIKYFGGLLNR